MRQALVSTERGYDLIAPKFDHTPFRTPDPVLEAIITVIGGRVGSALDVCCGTGAAMTHLRRLCSERVVGIDFSKGMLEEAERRVNASPGNARVELVRGDALEMPFNNEMDIVTSVGAFGHVLKKDEDQFMRGIVRAMKPGGRFVFATGRPPNAKDPWFWMAHGFNAVMRVRNAVWKPEFIMYYLTFLWPGVRALLEKHGLDVEVHEGLCEPPYQRVMIVSAKKR
jgi:ubiquinone/menaquinone biosynthesis C-methylase UbiE